MALTALGSEARGHPLSASYAHLAVDGERARLVLRLPLDDMDLLLRLDRNLDDVVSDDEIAAAGDALLKYVADRVTLSSGGAPAAPTLERVGRWLDAAAFPHVELTLVYGLDSSAALLGLQIRVLADLYSDHRTIADIEWGGNREQFVFQHGNAFEGSAASRSWWFAARTFARLGVEHILTGYDHLLFLAALLIAGRSVRELIAIVTSFTVAHSITLAVATLGWVTPPGWIVEAVIALSIVYVGVENLLATEVRGRWRLTFLFGLVHGFGFANVLREMALPSEALATGLLTFNLGVEVGQLAVVLGLWPVLRWIQRSSYGVTVVRWSSVVVVLCGVFWFVERVT